MTALVVSSCCLWSLLFDCSWPFLDSGDVAGLEVLPHSRPSSRSQMPAPGIVWLNVPVIPGWMFGVSVVSLGKGEYWKWIMNLISHWKCLSHVCGSNMGSFFLVVSVLAKNPKIVQVDPTYIWSACTHPTVEMFASIPVQCTSCMF